jgi:uncharacterized protein
MRLTNKTIMITGASSGIGESLALKLAKEDCNIILAARRIKKLKEIKNQIKSSRVLIVKADISDEKQVKNLFKKSIKKFGKIDILINNAGRGLHSEVQDISKNDWNSVIDTNLTGVFLCTKEAVNDMLKNNTQGHIIAVCSIAGLYGAPKYSAYCASKHGVTGFQRSIWLELRKKGIKVSTIYPARVDTEFFKVYKNKPSKNQMLNSEDIAEYIITIAKRSKLGRLGKRIKLTYKRIRNLIKH